MRWYLTILGACWLSAASTIQALDNEAVGTVIRVLGEVSVVRGRITGSLEPSAPIFQGDRIVTVAGARVKIRFHDGSTLTAGPDSKVDISAYAPPTAVAPLQRVLNLLTGIVRAVLAPGNPDQNFQIRTQAAVASVRSTDWIVESTPKKTAVFVVAGRVEVTDASEQAMAILYPGFGTDVANGSVPTRPKRWGQARVSNTLERTRLP